MDADQAAISEYLKSWPGQFVSRREICRRAGGKSRYREDEHWAVPVLQCMVEKRIVEANETGHYRLLKPGAGTMEARNKQRVWLSPAMRSILKSSGQDFGVIDLDNEPESAGVVASNEPALAYQADPPNPFSDRGGFGTVQG